MKDDELYPCADFTASTKPVADWLPDYQTAFGINGMIALSWWLGSLMVTTIRNQHYSYPILEINGEKGSGKTDMVSFLWKLLGRENESFNPILSTYAGRMRKISNRFNLPIVFELEEIEDDSRSLNFDEIKGVYTGDHSVTASIKGTVEKQTVESGLMIIPKTPIAESEAIMYRLITVTFSRSRHSDEGRHASSRLNRLPDMYPSEFLAYVYQHTDEIMEMFNCRIIHHQENFTLNPKINSQRIIKNHAQVMALADCLSLVIPVSDSVIADIHRAVIGIAEAAQGHSVTDQVDTTYQINPLKTQIGGNHYKNFAIQPVEYIHQNNLGFLAGCVVKRICRYNKPGGKGAEDLKKISHEIDLLLNQINKGFIGSGSLKPRDLAIKPDIFCEINGLSKEQAAIIELITADDQGIQALCKVKDIANTLLQELNQQGWLTDAKKTDEQDSWVRDNEATYHMLLMISDVGVSPIDIEGWTDEQCREVETWAAAVHLSASDHHDVIIPPMPYFIEYEAILTVQS